MALETRSSGYSLPYGHMLESVLSQTHLLGPRALGRRRFGSVVW